MTTLCEFRHEAGPEYDGLAARLETALKGVPELVEEVTGLRLPTNPPPLVLLAGREQWRRASAINDEELIRREAAAMGLSARQVEQATSDRRAIHERTQTRWINVSGMLCRSRDGRPQLVAVADSLHHSGAPDAKLVKLVGHELTHVAQHDASGGRILDYANSWISRRRQGAGPGAAPLEAFSLVEGHALWADQQILSLLGHPPVGFGEGTYTELGERERARWEDEAHTTWLGMYEAGHAFVRHVVEQRGREVINRVWRDPDRLCPTGPEIDAPDTYLAYLDYHVNRRHGGLPPVLGPSAVPDLGVMAQWAAPNGQQPQP